MGKGTIISHLGDGEYQVEVNYNRSAYEEQIDYLEKKIEALQEEIDRLMEIYNNTEGEEY